ncbi:MAG: hypothetical protein ACE5DP_00385 [Fidelibacterota bacterium]
MWKYDIVITFFTIIYGLMLTDLFFSFHKLIRARKNVQWHWLPLLAAWYLFLIILKNWWDLSAFQNSTDWMNILFFIAYGHLLLLIFLLVSTILPDVIGQKGVDLKSYYFKNHRYFWGLMTSVVVLSTLINLFKQIHELSQFNIYNISAVGIYIVLLTVLTISKRYWVHSVLLVIFTIATMLEILNK